MKMWIREHARVFALLELAQIENVAREVTNKVDMQRHAHDEFAKVEKVEPRKDRVVGHAESLFLMNSPKVENVEPRTDKEVGHAETLPLMNSSKSKMKPPRNDIVDDHVAGNDKDVFPSVVQDEKFSCMCGANRLCARAPVSRFVKATGPLTDLTRDGERGTHR